SVFGYQLNSGVRENFKVVSQAESKAREMDYGEFIGTISISVFPQQLTTPKVDLKSLSAEGEDFALMTRGAFPTKTPQNFSALKTQIMGEALRNVIVNGKKEENNIKVVPFTPDTVPMMSATIRYYNAQDLPQ